MYLHALEIIFEGIYYDLKRNRPLNHWGNPKQTGGIEMNTNPKTVKLTKLAMLATISLVFVAIIRIPIFPAAPYLTYDPADIPIFIAAFAFGPLAGL